MHASDKTVYRERAVVMAAFVLQWPRSGESVRTSRRSRILECRGRSSFHEVRRWDSPRRWTRTACRPSRPSPFSLCCKDQDAFRLVPSATELLRDAHGHIAPVRKADGGRPTAVVIGAGLAGLTAAVELADAGYAVQVYEARSFYGGKVGSWQDAAGNHIEMGLHVFFGCYYNLFDVMRKLGVLERHFLPKEHRHMFVNDGGRVAELDFRLGGIGAPWNGLKAFFTTEQLPLLHKLRNAVALGTSPVVRALLDFDGAMEQVRALDDISFSEWFRRHGGSRHSLERLWNPIAYALGFLDCDAISARCMLTIFQLFAVRTEASQLRLLIGAPGEYMLRPMVEYIEQRGGRVVLRRGARELVTEVADSSTTNTSSEPVERIRGVVLRRLPSETADPFVPADVVIAALDVPGMQRLMPDAWRRRYRYFDNIAQLKTVPVATVQLRFNGWVTELHHGDPVKPPQPPVHGGRGLDNLLYSADADFSCFADLAITSPADYYREGDGSLLQCVLTPADRYMPMSNEAIATEVLQQVYRLFPSARTLQCTWSHVVKLAQSLYREEPGADRLRPQQRSPIQGLYLAGSYTQQDYIDSQEGAVRSGRLAVYAAVEDALRRQKSGEEERRRVSTVVSRGG